VGVLVQLLDVAFPGRDELRLQAESARVRNIAPQGDHYGTIEFQIRERNSAPVEWSVPIEAVGFDVDGVEIDLLLHVKEGILNSLEVLKADGSDVIRAPAPSDISVHRPHYGGRRT
jgi:hypothetical protein